MSLLFVVGFKPTTTYASTSNDLVGFESFGVLSLDYLYGVNNTWYTFFTTEQDGIWSGNLNGPSFMKDKTNMYIDLVIAYDSHPIELSFYDTLAYSIEFYHLGANSGFIDNYSSAFISVSFVGDSNYYQCGIVDNISYGACTTLSGILTGVSGRVDSILISLGTNILNSTSERALGSTGNTYDGFTFSAPYVVRMEKGIVSDFEEDTEIPDNYYEDSLKLTNDIFENIKIIGSYIMAIPSNILSGITSAFNDLIVRIGSFFTGLGDTIGGFFDGLAYDIAMAVASLFNLDDYQEGNSSISPEIDEALNNGVVLPDIGEFVPNSNSPLLGVFKVFFDVDLIYYMLLVVTVVGVTAFFIFK